MKIHNLYYVMGLLVLKTYVSIYKALQDVLRRGTLYNKLIIINPTVDVGNEDKLGYFK